MVLCVGIRRNDGFFVVILLLGFLSSLMLGLFSYIVESIYMMGALKADQADLPALAWVPIYGQYLYGKLAGVRYLGTVLALLHVAVSFCCVLLSSLNADVLLFNVILLLWITGYIIKLVANYRMYRAAMPEKRWLLTALSILSFGWLRPVILLVFRKKFTSVGMCNLHKREENKL